MIIINGRHSVLEALKQGNGVLEILVSQQADPRDKEFMKHAAQQHGIPFRLFDKYDAKKRFKLDKPASILARVKEPGIQPLSALHPDRHPAVVVLDHLEDPHNVGAIIRTCVGLGVSAIVIPKDRQAALSAGVIKASAGAAYHICIIQVANIAQALQNCEKLGYWIFATDSEQGTSLKSIEPLSPFMLVMGNEHKGISKRVSKMAHHHIRIDMKGHIQSLNVSVSTGIILHHLTSS